MKLHDQTELLSTDIANAVRAMHAAKRYRQLLLILDTCQAATLYSDLSDVPGWAGISSSTLGQSSYALHSDVFIGAHLVDEFSYHLSQFLDALTVEEARDGGVSVGDMVRYLKSKKMSSEIDVETTNFLFSSPDSDLVGGGGGVGGGREGKKKKKGLDDVSIIEFFGSTNSNDCEENGWIPIVGGGGGDGGGKGDDEVQSSFSPPSSSPSSRETSVYDALIHAWR